MDKITLVSSHQSDARVLEDLLRAHFPGKILQYAGQEPPDSWDGLLLFINRASDGSAMEAILKTEDREYRHTAVLAENQLPEAEINQKRRVLRLAVYQVVRKYFADNRRMASPWGVLTGVRPTKIVHRLFAHGLDSTGAEDHLQRDYGLREDKARLVTKIAEFQRPYLLTAEEAKSRISIYIAIPFCPSRCFYCSFPSFSLERWGRFLNGYLEALSREMTACASFLRREGITVQTVYLGGGTPTVLSCGQLEELLSMIRQEFPLEEDCELTVEAGRPDTLDWQKLFSLKRGKTTRLSINPQTMCGETLQAIGRKHSPSEIVQSFLQAKEIGFPVINMDLIVGLPGENRTVLKETLQKVLELAPENITLHALAIKRGAFLRQQGVLPANWEEGQAMMELAHNTLQHKGYIPYYLYRQKEILAYAENVGYTLPGNPCLYNIQMMEERQTILGFGVGAGNKIIKVKDWSVDNFYNPKDLLVYLQRLDDLIIKKVDKLKGFVYNNF